MEFKAFILFIAIVEGLLGVANLGFFFFGEHLGLSLGVGLFNLILSAIIFGLWHNGN